MTAARRRVAAVRWDEQAATATDEVLPSRHPASAGDRLAWRRLAGGRWRPMLARPVVGPADPPGRPDQMAWRLATTAAAVRSLAPAAASAAVAPPRLGASAEEERHGHGAGSGAAAGTASAPRPGVQAQARELVFRVLPARDEPSAAPRAEMPARSPSRVEPGAASPRLEDGRRAPRPRPLAPPRTFRARRQAQALPAGVRRLVLSLRRRLPGLAAPMPARRPATRRAQGPGPPARPPPALGPGTRSPGHRLAQAPPQVRPLQPTAVPPRQFQPVSAESS
jgi:hypothetical protein